MRRSRDYEDVTRQSDHLAQALLDLRDVLGELADVARSEARMRQPDLDRVLTRVNQMRRAGEAVDIAAMDLDAARGEDV